MGLPVEWTITLILQKRKLKLRGIKEQVSNNNSDSDQPQFTELCSGCPYLTLDSSLVPIIRWNEGA